MPRHRIPPLNPLKVFDVVARHQNLTTAAEELHVSQSAVSRQIAALESYLGVQLFTRERIGVRLTGLGALYASQIAPAFDTIAEATSLINQRYTDDVIRLRTYTTLTARWLIPRLPQFRAQHPGVKVVINNSTLPLDFAAEQCDLAILLGDGNWQGADAALLFDDIIEPVCTPGFLDAATSPRAALQGKNLLISKYRRDDWMLWLTHAGLQDLYEPAEKMAFNSSILTWQAAMEALGIAIGQHHLLQQDLQAGRLVHPFSKPLHTGKAHYVVTPALQRFSPKIRAFKDWLIEEGRATRLDHA